MRVGLQGHARRRKAELSWALDNAARVRTEAARRGGAQSLLGEPNNDSPLNVHAAKLWPNADEYRRQLHRKYAESAAK